MAQSKLKSRETFVSQESEQPESAVIFRFNLPDGLSLRSASVVDGAAELRFTSSPRVPSLLESDVAAAFRLAAEKKRPEFFYVCFPLDHPLYGSRWYKDYCPIWLRGTTLGELLADVDWNMKCLHVGAKSNEDKTSFKSWPISSNLKGLATRLDFPMKDTGSIKMYCDHAIVQKSDEEIFFPEEPKMKIVDQNSPQYSKYITEHLSSVAYHDEPKFLKMQEVIKLILAVEWLYNEKKVRVDQSWIQLHTENFTEENNCSFLQSFHESKPPPEDMIPPTPSDFKPPSTDVTVSAKHSQMYKALMENQAKRRYGYTDFKGCEVRIFTEEGESLYFQSSLKQSLTWHTPDGDINHINYTAIDQLYLKNCAELMDTLKFPFPLEDEEHISETPDPILNPPKVPLNHESFVTKLDNIVIEGSLSNIRKPINSDRTNHINKESLTDKLTVSNESVSMALGELAEVGSPTSELPSSNDKTKPNIEKKKDLSIPKQELSTATDTPAIKLPLFQTEAMHQVIDKLKRSHNIDCFGPLETLTQAIQDPSTDESQIPTEEHYFQTMKTCLEKMFELVIKTGYPIPVTVLVHINDYYFDDDFKMTANVSISRHVPFTLPLFEITGTLKVAVEDMDYIFSHIDPNTPVRPAIPGLWEALIPQVMSWDELLTELSTPVPRFWLEPYTGIGQPTATGGVSTKIIPTVAACAVPILNTVGLAGTLLNKSGIPKRDPPEPQFNSEPPLGQRSPPKTTSQSGGNSESHNESKPSANPTYSHNESYGENKRKTRKHRTKGSSEVYGTNGEALIVHATETRGNIEMLKDKEKKDISEKFKKSWKGNPPEVVVIFKIENVKLEKRWKHYRSKLPPHLKEYEEYYHGTVLLCSIADKHKLCTLRNCEVCSIAHSGMNKESSKRHKSFKYFKEAVILSPHSSSCDEYTEENKNHYRAILLCDVLPGQKYNLQTRNDYCKLPKGYHSFHATTDDDLTSPVLVVAAYEAILPKYIIVYKHTV